MHVHNYAAEQTTHYVHVQCRYPTDSCNITKWILFHFDDLHLLVKWLVLIAEKENSVIQSLYKHPHTIAIANATAHLITCTQEY